MSEYQNPFAVGTAADAKAVKEFHTQDDLDSGRLAHHHTLGDGPNQAAVGADVADLKGGASRVGSFDYALRTDETKYWKLANGQSLVKNDYLELFNLFASVLGNGYYFGGAGANFNLPNLADRALAMTGILFPALGAAVGGLTSALPNHAHNIASHTHTIPNHNHAVPDHTHGAGTYGTNTFNHNQATDTTATAGANRLTGPVGHSHSVNGTSASGGPGSTSTDGGGGATSGVAQTSNTDGGGAAISVVQPTFIVNIFIRVK